MNVNLTSEESGELLSQDIHVEMCAFIKLR